MRIKLKKKKKGIIATPLEINLDLYTARNESRSI